MLKIMIFCVSTLILFFISNILFAGDTFENDKDIVLLFTEYPALELPQDIKDSIVQKKIGFVLLVKIVTDFKNITNVRVFPVLNYYNRLKAEDSLWQKIQYYTLESAKKWKVRPDDIVEQDSVYKYINNSDYSDDLKEMLVQDYCVPKSTFIGSHCFLTTIVIGFIDPEDQDSDVGWARLFGPVGQRNCYLQYLVNEDDYEPEKEEK